MSLAVEHVTHVYEHDGPSAVAALQDISLTIADREAVGVIGPTGSGKSTLIQILAGLLRPTAGRVFIDGVDLWAQRRDRRRLRLQVGLVFQYPEQQLFEETVEADVAFGPANLGLEPDEIRRRVRRALRRVGLGEEFLSRSPFALSGGQMRRVAIAGVLAMEPRVLILDEPTAGLDPRGRVELLGYVRELNRRDGLTVVLVSHDMDEVAQLADRVVVLHQGRLLLDGPVRRVYTEIDRLRQIGLDAPFPMRLADALVQCGWPLRRDVLTMDEVVETILDACATAR